MSEESSGASKQPVASGQGRSTLTIAQMLFALVIFFFLGPLALSNIWGYSQSRRYLTEAAFRNIRNVAALQASETLKVVSSAESLVPSIVMGNEHLFGILKRWAVEEDPLGTARLAQQLHHHLAAKAQENSSVAEFYVLSAGGVLVSSSQGVAAAGRDLSGSACFERREQAGVVGFASEGASEEATAAAGAGSPASRREPGFVIASPVRDDNGAFLGVFCGLFRLDMQQQLMMAHRERTDRAMLYLLDEQGRIVSGSFDPASSQLIGKPFDASLRPMPAPRHVVEGRYRLPSGEEMLMAYAPIPVFDWAMVVEVPVAQALADLERLKWEAMGASALLGLVLLGCVFLVWRMAVLPLRALSRTAETMASGASGRTVEPSGPSELIDLARAFNRMSLGLKDSQDLLEARITERTRELRESRAFLELLLDSIDQRMIVVDLTLRIVQANSAAVRMHGRALVGELCCAALEGADTPAADCPIRRTIETGKPVSEERSQRTVRGIEPVRVETYPIFDADGEVESVVELGRVITEEKRLQAQMVHQEKMAAFGQLAAGVAHEIGNPIAAIQSQLQLAQEEPSARPQTLELIEKQVGRMARILRQLVEFTRRRDDELRLASVNEVVEDVARLVEHHPRARGVSIQMALGDKLPAVCVNEDHLVQVLLNLALNSLDAIEGRGILTFETLEERGRVCVRVRDTGSGIAAESQDHVFEPFFSTKGAGRGTGLGLFVSKQIMEGMGGSLELEETSPRGTVFVVRISTREPRASVDATETGEEH